MKLKPQETNINQTWWIESIEHDKPNIQGYYCVIQGEYRYKQIKTIKVIKPEIYNQYWDEIIGIQKYCNEQFKNIAITYKLATPLIDIREDMIYQKGTKVR